MALNRNNDQSNQPDDNDIEFHLKLKLSPKLKKFIVTTIKSTIGQILIPLLLKGLMVIPHGENFPQPSLPPDSIDQIIKETN
jgi:hypothetical protein